MYPEGICHATQQTPASATLLNPQCTCVEPGLPFTLVLSSSCVIWLWLCLL